MKKICCVLIFLILVPAFSYAEISGNLDGFKKSNFFIKYKFSPDAKPYTVNARTFIDFYQKETLDKVMIELDSKSNRIIKQIGYLKDKGTVGELIMDFITEATGGKVEDKTIADLLNEFNAGFKKEGKLELGGMPSGTTKEKRMGQCYVTIEKTILDEYIVTAEGVKEVEKREGEYKEFVQKLEKGDYESYILKGLMAEEERNMNPTREAYIRSLENAIPNYQKAVELAPDNPDANLLLAKACISVEKYEKAVTLLEHYLSLKPDDKYAHYYLGKAYHALRNNNPAEKILKNGVTLVGENKNHVDKDKYSYYRWSYWDENFPTLYYAINHIYGVVLKELNKYDDAIETYQKVISMKPIEELSNPDGQLYLELGEIYWLKGDRESAKEVLNKLRSVDRFKYWADKLETIMQKE